MSRTITLDQLKTICRQRADMEHTDFIADSTSNTEIIDYINSSIAELHDILIQSFEDYYVTSRVFTTATTQDIYPLPGDFYKMIRVEADSNNTFSNALILRNFSMREWTRNTAGAIFYRTSYPITQYRVSGKNIILMPKPASQGYVRMWYYPPAKFLSDSIRTFTDSDVSIANDTISFLSHGYNTGDRISFTNSGGSLPSPLIDSTDYYVIPTMDNLFQLASSIQNAFDNIAIDLTSASGGGTNTIEDDRALYDGQNGWEEYVIVDVAMKMLEKEESDTSALAARKAYLLSRIKSASKDRDSGEPHRMMDVYQEMNYFPSYRGRAF